MWLWYLELYLAILAAFALGAGAALVLVRLVVRRTTESPSSVKSGNGSSEPAAGPST